MHGLLSDGSNLRVIKLRCCQGKSHDCFVACSYYINPLSWTLYGIIVTQLGDETNVVRVLPCVYPVALREIVAWHCAIIQD